MGKKLSFAFSISLVVIGFMIILLKGDSNDPPDEKLDELYWAFYGCLTCFSGIIIAIITLVWPSKEIELNSSETENKMSIPSPVISDND